jgi:hypothetical protein
MEIVQSHSMETLQYIPIPSVLDTSINQHSPRTLQSRVSLHTQEDAAKSFITHAYKKKTQPQLRKLTPENICIAINSEKEKIQELQEQNNTENNMVSHCTLACVTGLGALAALIPTWILIGIWCSTRTNGCF